MTAFGKVQTNVWKQALMSAGEIADASLGVSTREKTITLSGKIPGIIAEFRLAFHTFDYLGGSDCAPVGRLPDTP